MKKKYKGNTTYYTRKEDDPPVVSYAKCFEGSVRAYDLCHRLVSSIAKPIKNCMALENAKLEKLMIHPSYASTNTSQ
jgi:hypothetical protein